MVMLVNLILLLEEKVILSNLAQQSYHIMSLWKDNKFGTINFNFNPTSVTLKPFK